MIELTAAQATIFIGLVSLLKDGIIDFAKYYENVNKVANLTDGQLDPFIESEEVRTDLLMAKLDEI